MTDGTGTSTYAYDQLDRLTETSQETTEHHQDTVGYAYNLNNEPERITYPNGHAVERTYDSAGRLKAVKDWLSNTTGFSYDPDSDLAATSFPSGTGGEADTYAYNDADQQSEAKMAKGTEMQASLAYTRDSNGQLTKTVSHGLPGGETTEYEYNEDEQLTKAGSTSYEYDPAANLTKIGTATNKYSAAEELTESGATGYAYNEDGERTEMTPASGPATTYGYDEAGDLTSVARPAEGSSPKIEDAYAYNGDGLRTAQTISGTTSYMTWDVAEGLPLLLTDGTDSYIYGPDGLPVEQVSSSGTVSYLHHDQQGSTRLLTSSSGEVVGKCSYSAYGSPDCEGSASTPMGYDGQYTNADTGLVYLRAREYDPATGQFLTVDPFAAISGERYSYAEDDPIDKYDPSGRCGIVCAVGVVAGGVALATGVGEVVGAGAALGFAAGDLTAASFGFGIVGAAADAHECYEGEAIACVGLGTGVVATAGAGAGLGPVAALISDTAASGATAIGVTFGAIGFLSDVGAALAPSNVSARGCE
jgi:RHS repeat-associated protein